MLAGVRALLPSQCDVCRAWDHGLVCRACVERHAPLRPRCRRCGLVLGAAAASCGACLADPPPWVSTVCALDYVFPWDRLITSLKFHGRIELAQPLAALLVDAVAAALPGTASAQPQLVVPVPASARRLAERGFNPAWELARRVAHRHGLRCAPEALHRVLEASPQAGLTAEARRRNLRNAFAPAAAAVRGGGLAGQDVALVDDVMTTGATAREVSAALRRAGARSVQLWVLARTPLPATD